ncbi:MAG: ribonuclease P protein component [Candidatus Coatesbacteria bacterium RBG_13_66_14]|uniref:Ribonuclease P protein component n=1 Tax=Candidatus Coatesbacteria bacterium RBG_13_66_14 TaxID=1817816 RepID=A0A1F5F6V9_9BACT|nr:MAG: ribonuclease P protein component [Candidatus Coatesbacteria bacterium RBG_13_66_14]
MRYTYPRSSRLTSARDFRRLFRSGRRLQSGPLRLVWLAEGVEGVRYTTVAGRKVGNAVVRNRVRRRLRELFRLNRHLIQSPAHLALVAGPGAGELPGGELRLLALELWERAGLLGSEDGP